MPPRKPKNNQATNSGAIALAGCEDLMLCVLARLPGKSIIRFKSVCKSWNHLLSTQEFVKMQFKLSNESKNQSFLVHNKNGNNELISVFNIESNEKKAKIHYYTQACVGIVGCCRGMVCIRHGRRFALWNPAMNLSKTVLPLKDADAEDDDFESVSLGFGYDAEGDDFKVVMILLKYNKRKFGMCVTCVEVYSVNSDSWTKIDPGLEFSKLKIYRINNTAIVNGNPYWVGKGDQSKDVLICFDMSKLVFKIVPLSSLDYNKAKLNIKFVDLNGSFGALVFTWRYDNTIAYVHAWLFDEVEQIWTKSHSVGPIEVKMNRVLRCFKDGRVLGKQPNGQLTVFNSETKCVKSILNVGQSSEIYDYTATLAYIQGMKKVNLIQEMKKVKLRKRRDHWNKSKLLRVCFLLCS